jgi:hypothetical protein
VTLRSTIGFLLGAAAASTAGAMTLLPWLLAGDRLDFNWAATGFLAMAVPGIAAGAWFARAYGRPGSQFALALAAGAGARMVLAALAAIFAARASAGTALVAGLAAGFVPVTTYEIVWFARMSAGHSNMKSRG